jgi:hypothetical protein
MDSTAAKQFLISRIISEADFEHVMLSEVEKKMLHFSESEPETTGVAAEFERVSDTDKFEQNVIALLKHARARDLAQSPQFKEMWADAVSALEGKDLYVLVFVYFAFPEYRKKIVPAHRARDYAIYIAIGIALVLGLVGMSLWIH